MSNNSIWVRVIGDRRNFKYEWGMLGGETNIGLPGTYEGLFHILVKDIYRDKIPVGNIEISDSIRNDFENFKICNRDLIMELESQPPFNWNGYLLIGTIHH